jgi:hypothetical protein
MAALASAAQVPQKINYQGVVRDAAGAAITNSSIAVKFELLQGSPATVIFSEVQHSLPTGLTGVFSTQIGKETTNGLNGIISGPGPYTLQVSVDLSDGENFVSIGSQELVSVPFAMHAQSIPAAYNATANIISIGDKTFTLSSMAGQTVDIQPGNGNITVSGAYPNYSISSTPSLSINGSSISISGGNAVTLPTAPTLTGTGAATVSTIGSSHTIDVTPPTFSNTGQAIITGSYPNYIVNTPTVAATFPTSITPGGIVSVSNPGTNTFVVSVPSPTFTSVGPANITGTYPNLTITSPTVPAATPNTSISPGGIAQVTNPTTNSFVVSVPSPTFTSAGPVTITGAYPNLTVNSTAAGNATVSQGATGIISVSNPATNSFVVSAPTPTFTNTGQNIITGTYPNYSVNTPTFASTGATVSQGATGIISVSNPATNSFVVSAPSPTFTSSGPVTVGGTYPNLTITSPTVPPTTTVSPSGFVTVSNPITNSFVVGVQTPTFTNTGQNIITGTYPNYSVNTPTFASTGATVSQGATGIISVSNPATNSFVVSAPTPTFTNSGQNIITGTYPNYVVNTPTVATNNATVSPGASGIVSVSNPATNSFVVSVPSPTYTSAGPVTITGAYPNLTVNSTAAANATVSQGATGIISVSNPSTNSFVVSAPSPTFTSVGPSSITGTYPNLTITSPTVPPATTVSPGSSGIVSVSNPATGSFVVSVPSPTYTSSGPVTITGAYPNLTVNSTAAANATVSQGATGIISVSNPATNSFVVSAPEPTFTSVGPSSITGTYPNLTITSPVSTTVSPGSSGIVSVSNPATGSFVVSVPSPTYTSSGPVTITGTYPNLTVNSTAAANATVSQGATGIISVSNPATNSFVVSAPSPTFTSAGPVTVGGTYPNLTITSPTVPPTTTVSPGTGIVTVSNPATNSFVVSAQTPTFTNVSQSIITGTYPNYSVNTPTYAANNATVSQGAGGIVSVSNPATNSFVVSVPSPNYTSSGPVTITGTYPNLTVTSPTVPPTTSVSAVSGGIITVSNPATNSFVVSVPHPTFTSVGPASITGTHPNYTITAPNPVTPSVTGTGLASVTPATGTSFTVNVPVLTYTSSTGILASGSNTVTVLPTMSFTNNILTLGPASNSISLAASSPWIQGSNQVTLSTIADRVGIGTNAPSAVLSVVNNTLSDGMSVDVNNISNGSNAVQVRHFGIGNAGYFEVNNSSSNGRAFEALSNANNHSMRVVNSGTTLTNYAGTFEGGLMVTGKNSTNTAVAFRARNSLFQDIMVAQNDGNVGIGTSSPWTKLTVSGSYNSSSNASYQLQ